MLQHNGTWKDEGRSTFSRCSNETDTQEHKNLARNTTGNESKSIIQQDKVVVYHNHLLGSQDVIIAHKPAKVWEEPHQNQRNNSKMKGEMSSTRSNVRQAERKAAEQICRSKLRIRRHDSLSLISVTNVQGHSTWVMFALWIKLTQDIQRNSWGHTIYQETEPTDTPNWIRCTAF